VDVDSFTGADGSQAQERWEFDSPSPSAADLREDKTQEGNGRPEPLTGSGKENGLERRAKP
jgi:hypothetical protein